jgi:hypothetical protein
VIFLSTSGPDDEDFLFGSSLLVMDLTVMCGPINETGPTGRGFRR